MTIGGNYYLRDYSFILIYNKNNKSLFQHEHAIFISDYFIRKKRNSSHLYIDGTSVYQKWFKQLIVILYYDGELKKRLQSLFALTNNKKENWYDLLFNKIYDIITLNKTKNLALQSFTVDFESDLINATKRVFKKSKCVVYYYHYKE